MVNSYSVCKRAYWIIRESFVSVDFTGRIKWNRITLKLPSLREINHGLAIYHVNADKENAKCIRVCDLCDFVGKIIKFTLQWFLSKAIIWQLCVSQRFIFQCCEIVNSCTFHVLLVFSLQNWFTIYYIKWFKYNIFMN